MARAFFSVHVTNYFLIHCVSSYLTNNYYFQNLTPMYGYSNPNPEVCLAVGSQAN